MEIDTNLQNEFIDVIICSIIPVAIAYSAKLNIRNKTNNNVME